VTVGSANQRGEVALMSSKREPDVEDVIGGDRRPEVIHRLIANIDCRRGLDFGGEGDGDDPDVLAMRAGDFDQRLVFVMRHHLELTIGQALAALGALEPTRLPAKDI
jgi:hypothetical protein